MSLNVKQPLGPNLYFRVHVFRSLLEHNLCTLNVMSTYDCDKELVSVVNDTLSKFTKSWCSYPYNSSQPSLNLTIQTYILFLFILYLIL